MNYHREFHVGPGSKTRLDDFDPQFAGKHESKKSALSKIAKLQERMDEL